MIPSQHSSNWSSVIRHWTFRVGALLVFTTSASAANRTWSGASSTDFDLPANWSGATAPVSDLVTDLAVFSGNVTARQPQLSANRSITGLAFTTPSGAWALRGNTTAAPVLTLGASGISTAGQISGNTTVSANLALGAAQSWSAGTGGTLLITGNVTGASGLPLVINSTGYLGTVVLSPAAGNVVSLTGGNSSAMFLQVRTGGLLALGGDGVSAPVTSSVNTITNSGTFGSLAITGNGSVRVNSGTWNFGDFGRNGSADFFSGSLDARGGVISFNGARFLGAGNLTVNGGTVRVTNVGSIYSNGGKFSLGSTGTVGGNASLTLNSGLLDLAQANSIVGGGNSLGIAINTRAVQSGGVFQNGLTAGGGTNGGNTTSFTIGHSGLISANSGANLTYTAVSNILTSYTLSGGTFLSAGAVMGTAPASPGTNGSTASPPSAVVNTGTGNVRNFNFTGGTLAIGAYTAANLGYASATGLAGGPPHSDPAANSVGIGTLYNHGGILAPGGAGTAGKTSLTGNYIVASSAASFAVDLGGTTPATAFQHTSGCHDVLSVSGDTVLGGNLTVNVLPGFLLSAGQSFTVLTSNGTVSESFSNVAFGSRVLANDGVSTLLVSLSGNSVVLGDYVPLAAPVITGSSSPSHYSVGDSAVLGVTASSLVPVTYVWTKDGGLIPGATSSALTLIGLTEANAGTYQVVATNSIGSVSQSFTVALSTPASTASIVIDAGATQSFAASAAASSYQWFLDGDAGGTARTFAYSPTSKAVGTHWLRAVETYAAGSPVTRTWSIRVRIPVPVSTVNYYVSPTGSDAAAGSLGAPFATLEKARDTIRLLSRPLPAGGITVFLRGGVYRRTTTFALTSSDSGSASAPVIYTAYPGETPILTGARPILASQVTPLAVSEQSRLASGIDPARVFEIDVTGNTRAATFPSVFNEWWIYNALRSTQNGGLLELFYNGERKPLSRYPNIDPTDDTLTTNLTMNGVAAGTAADGTGYLNGAGTYTDSNGNAFAVGGAFQFNASDAARVARWQTAMTKGGVWLAGYWRVPWQLNAVKIGLLDTGSKQVIALASGASVSNGIGNKYTRPLGNKKEPYWAINLLEELDQSGEWCVDFNRKKLYLLLDSTTAPADGVIELSDLGTPLFQLNGASDVYLQGLSFRRQLGHAVQILGGARNLVLGCAFSQNGNFAVDINGGTSHGVVSCSMEKLGSGGVILRGGTETPSLDNSDQFVVNNKFNRFGDVVRVYQAAIDSGYGGPIGSSKQISVGTRIAHNFASTSPHGAILWGSYNQTIEYNELSDFCRISEDLGAIYRFGPNYVSASVIRYNHPHDSRLGEGIYNDFDHLEVAIYGNVTNLKTPSTAGRGYGFWTNTSTAVGGAVTGVPMALNLYNNIAVNSRSNYSLHSSTGGVIQNNISYRKLANDFAWYRITSNATTSTNTYATSNATTLQSGPNIGYTTDPGFIDFANDDLRLRPDAKAYTDMPGFVPVPLEMAGLYNDEYRSDARVWTPFIVTAAASSVGANTATFNATLVYPQFEPNATVRVYWGTTDGGNDAASWQNVAVLGQPGSGAVSHTRADLTPATRYYYRFHVVNSAGEDWADQSNSTTTFPLTPAPSGSASADSAATDPGLAFDGLPATAWRTTDGTISGVLTYQFSNNTAALVTRYSVTSAADSPARDPRDWQLLGSYDGVNWVLLDTRAGQSFSARGQTLTFGFVSTSAFKFYRLNVTANNGDATALKLADLAFFTPDLTPDTTGPVITTPGNLTVAGTGTSGAMVNFDVSAVDAVSGNAVATASPPSGTLFPVGVTTVTVSASDAAGNPCTSTFTITVTAPSIPAPWSISQIQPFSGVASGSVSVLGANSFQIVGTGGASTGGTTGDIWTGNNDSFTFFSQPWTGDGTFTARIASFTSTDTSAKAGIMFRETSTTGSRYSMTYLLRKGDAWAQDKTATSGSTTNTNFFTASSTGIGIPYWIRLVRTGDTFTNFISADGATWTQLGTAHANPLSGTTLTVGLAVGPRTGNTTATATFDNISFVTPLQAWSQLHFGTTSATGSAAPLADPDGDGVVNLLEYALGTTPTNADSFSSPILQVSGISPQPLLLQVSFLRARFDLTYTVEATSDLTSPYPWPAIATNPGTVGDSVTVTDSVDLSVTPRRFLRLKVTTSP